LASKSGKNGVGVKCRNQRLLTPALDSDPKKTRLAPGFNPMMASRFRAGSGARRSPFVDQRADPFERVIVSACPPSILAFRLMCGRIARRWISVTDDSGAQHGVRSIIG
jgi:hypothetical protein